MILLKICLFYLFVPMLFPWVFHGFPMVFPCFWLKNVATEDQWLQFGNGYDASQRITVKARRVTGEIPGITLNVRYLMNLCLFYVYSIVFCKYIHNVNIYIYIYNIYIRYVYIYLYIYIYIYI